MRNGSPFDADSAVLKLGSTEAKGTRLDLEPLSALTENLILYLNLDNGDECIAELVIDLAYHYAEHGSFHNTVSADTSFPLIQEPEFTITSIAILQADLVNTRFKLSLKINNPNIFPITLASFQYELHANNSFWAGGKEKNLAVIPAQGSADASFNFEMNFINMRRRLLDDIIAMRQVRYRIAGDMDWETGLAWLPSFRMRFDQSGYSAVLND